MRDQSCSFTPDGRYSLLPAERLHMIFGISLFAACRILMAGIFSGFLKRRCDEVGSGTPSELTVTWYSGFYQLKLTVRSVLERHLALLPDKASRCGSIRELGSPRVNV